MDDLGFPLEGALSGMQQGGKESLKYDLPGIEPSSQLLVRCKAATKPSELLHHLYPDRLTKLNLLYLSFGG